MECWLKCHGHTTNHSKVLIFQHWNYKFISHYILKENISYSKDKIIHPMNGLERRKETLILVGIELLVWELNSIQHNTLDLVCCGSHCLGIHLSSMLCTNNFRLRLLTPYERLCVHPVRNLTLSHQQTSHTFQYFMKISPMLSLIFLDCYISA